jgi:hypothetical protein
VLIFGGIRKAVEGVVQETVMEQNQNESQTQRLTNALFQPRDV